MKKKRNSGVCVKPVSQVLATFTFLLFIFSCASQQLLEIADYYHEIGDLFYEEKKFDQAAEVYQKSLRLDSEQPAILYNLAMIYIEAKNFSEARRTLKRFLDSDPENIKVQKSLAYSYFQEGNYDDAEKIYSLVYKKIPEDKELLYNIGTVRHLLKDYQGSQDAFQALLDFTQGASFDDRAYQMIVINLISLERFTESASYRQQMLNKGKFEEESLETICTLYRDKGETEQLYRFLSELDKVQDLEGDRAWEWVTLGFSYEDFEDALESLNTLVESEYKSLEKRKADLLDVQKKIASATAEQEEEQEKLDKDRAELEKKLKEAEKELKERRSQFFKEQKQGRSRTEAVFSKFEKQYEDKNRAVEEELEEAKEPAQESDSNEQENAVFSSE